MSEKFQDTKGRSWSIKLTFGILEEIREEVGTDILADPTSISLEPRKWVEMLWVCIQEQAGKLDVTPQEFGGSLDGECLRNGMEAFMEDLGSFLTPLMPEQAAVVKTAWTAVTEGRQAKAQLVLETLGRPFTESLELLESTRRDIAGGSSSPCSTGNTPKLKKAPQKRRRRRSRGRGQKPSQ